MYVIRSILAVAALITGSASLFVLRPEMLMPRLLTLLPLLEFFFILLHTPSDRSASFDSKAKVVNRLPQIFKAVCKNDFNRFFELSNSFAKFKPKSKPRS